MRCGESGLIDLRKNSPVKEIMFVPGEYGQEFRVPCTVEISMFSTKEADLLLPGSNTCMIRQPMDKTFNKLSVVSTHRCDYHYILVWWPPRKSYEWWPPRKSYER